MSWLIKVSELKRWNNNVVVSLKYNRALVDVGNVLLSSVWRYSPHLPIQLSAYTSGREMSGEFVYKGFYNSETSSCVFRMEAKATLHVIMCTILRFYETALAL